MTEAVVAGIFIHPAKAQPMLARERVKAIAGRGLQGDTYCATEGKTGEKDHLDREITLIEAEAIEALNRECGVPFEPAESRRNLLTRGVPLNHLVGREFQVGGATLRGIRLCEPCDHLEKLTRPGVIKGLLHRGGLRAQIVNDGEIQVGDPIRM